MKQIIKDKIDNLPLLPGCYLMKDKSGKIIYVGKAKKLKNRIPQYFLRPHEGKTQKMVSEIEDFDIIITGSEREALILELNLVHEHNPKYNILLKDDKQYPYIEISSHEHPILKIARKVNNKKSYYFGPYPNSSAAYEVIDILNRLFPLRKCRNIPKKECLYYHMKQCIGPCINEVCNENYKPIIDNIKKFLKGDVQEIKNELQKKMFEYSDNLEFEQAQRCKETLESIEYISSKQKVQFDDKVDRDVFAFHERVGYLSIAILNFRNGILCNKNTQVFNLYDDIEDSFISFIMQYYQNNIKPKEIILPTLENIDTLQEVLDCKVIVPTRGLKKDLLAMAGQNAFKAMDDQMLYKVIKSDKKILLDELSNLLSVSNISQIEMIDNSHLAGSDAVSAVVVFVNGVAEKKLYRKYRLNGSETRDDVASMKEVLTRRFTRMLNENAKLSDLLIVDGGITQLNAAKEVLNELNVPIAIAGLHKDEHHNTKGLINQEGIEVPLNNKDLLFMLTRMQDEVHRFVISYHRNLRSKSLTSSLLDDIEGIGEKRKEHLLKTFGSIQQIIKAPLSELEQYVPKNIALKIKKININE